MRGSSPASRTEKRAGRLLSDQGLALSGRDRHRRPATSVALEPVPDVAAGTGSAALPLAGSACGGCLSRLGKLALNGRDRHRRLATGVALEPVPGGRVRLVAFSDATYNDPLRSSCFQVVIPHPDDLTEG